MVIAGHIITLFPDRKYDLTEDSHKMVNIATYESLLCCIFPFCILYLTLLSEENRKRTQAIQQMARAAGLSADYALALGDP